jgi:hypothetical protein
MTGQILRQRILVERQRWTVQLQGPERPNGAQTVSDVLCQIHDQQLTAIPSETFGMDKIVEHCTD